jgi:hypothetical protein
MGEIPRWIPHANFRISEPAFEDGLQFAGLLLTNIAEVFFYGSGANLEGVIIRV